MHITKCCASWNCRKLLSCAQSRGFLPFQAFWLGSWECIPLCEKSHSQLCHCSIFFSILSVAAYTRNRAICLSNDSQITIIARKKLNAYAILSNLSKWKTPRWRIQHSLVYLDSTCCTTRFERLYGVWVHGGWSNLSVRVLFQKNMFCLNRNFRWRADYWIYVFICFYWNC